MQVLYIIPTMKQRFGVTAVAMNYFRNIDASKVKIDFLTYADSDEDVIKEIVRLGGKVYFMPKLGIKNIKSFKRYINSFFAEHLEYRVVHSHFNQIDSIVFPIAKKYGTKHCISHSHNTKYSDYKLRAIRNFIMCIPLKKNADTWAACSTVAGEFLYGKGFDENSKRLIIRNAIDITKFKYNPSVRENVRKKLKLDSTYVIGNVGSLKPQKNQKYVLDILYNLINANKDIVYKLLLIGDGDLKSELVNYSVELGIRDNIIFMGQRKDVNDLLQAMDVFVLPSLYEGLPVIGIEAQAAGLPCLFSDNITKEVDLCNAKFLPLMNDTEKWEEAIAKLQNYYREDTEGIIRNKGFDITVEAEKMQEYYMECC